jgi:hypothetical protein
MNNETTVEYWHGRLSADSRTIFCGQNGRATARWKRRRGKWKVVEIVLRPVIFQGSDGSFALGEPRYILPRIEGMSNGQ